ncbi:hypothetical protein ACFZC5_21620 [Nocardia gamkensis]|uniref:DoxX family protein n=1 Tax=Nocardia gamkensis TaxID=352869 RepID=UPI0036EDA2A2
MASVEHADASERAAASTARRLAALLFGVGILHFLAPQPFDSVIPARLPGRPRLYTLGSGVAELVVAAALVTPRTRRWGGRWAAWLFLAVFPANIQMAVDWLRNDRIPAPVKAVALAASVANPTGARRQEGATSRPRAALTRSRTRPCPPWREPLTHSGAPTARRCVGLSVERLPERSGDPCARAGE